VTDFLRRDKGEAVAGKVPEDLKNRPGIAMAQHTYRAASFN